MKQLFQYLNDSYNSERQEFIEPCNKTNTSEKEELLNEIEDSSEKLQENIIEDNQVE